MADQSKIYTNIRDQKYGLDRFNVNIFIGMRGMGKTYSALAPYVDGTMDTNFLLNRLSSKEVDLITSMAGNVFKSLNDNIGRQLCFFRESKDLYEACDYVIEDHKPVRASDPIGYCCSLVTMGGICGMDFSDVGEYIIDEFIPRGSKRNNRKKFDDIMAAWETINRNRELKGHDPCKLIMLSNSNNIYDEVLQGFDLVQEAEKMVVEQRQDYYDLDRSIAFHILAAEEEFKDFKLGTAVARATRGTEYGEMAYDNKFAYNDFSGVKHQDLRGWRCLCSLDGRGYLYQSKDGRYHVTYRRALAPDYPLKTNIYKRFFRRAFPYLEEEWVLDNVTFESYELKELFASAFM